MADIPIIPSNFATDGDIPSLANYLSSIAVADLPNIPFNKLPNNLATDGDIPIIPSNLATDGDIPSLANYLSNITLADLPAGLATDGDIPSLANYLSNITLADLPNNVATDGDLPNLANYLSSVTAADLPNNLVTDGDIPDLTSYIDSDGLFSEIVPFIGSVNAVLGTGIPYFRFYVDYDNELININQDLLAVQFQTILDRLQGMENNVSSLTGRVTTLES